EIRRESATVSSFRLVPEHDGGPAPQAVAGQYLTLRLQPDPAAPPLVRSYSLSDEAGEHGYRISVKREGAGSRYLHEHVRVGDVPDPAARPDDVALERAAPPVDADYYLCGPVAFMQAMEAALTARGLAPDRIATETFGAVAVYASGIVSPGRRDPHLPDGP